MKLDEENRVVSRGIVVFREGRQGNPEEVLKLFGLSLDEARRLNIGTRRRPTCR
jgi:hypothetical protein